MGHGSGDALDAASARSSRPAPQMERRPWGLHFHGLRDLFATYRDATATVTATRLRRRDDPGRRRGEREGERARRFRSNDGIGPDRPLGPVGKPSLARGRRGHRGQPVTAAPAAGSIPRGVRDKAARTGKVFPRCLARLRRGGPVRPSTQNQRRFAPRLYTRAPSGRSARHS